VLAFGAAPVKTAVPAGFKARLGRAFDSQELGEHMLEQLAVVLLFALTCGAVLWVMKSGD
jgi:hypothetical protein